MFDPQYFHLNDFDYKKVKFKRKKPTCTLDLSSHDGYLMKEE